MNEYNVINTSQKKSDWNANEGEAGYIKNRTHYIETGNSITGTFTLTQEDIEQEEIEIQNSPIAEEIFNIFKNEMNLNTDIILNNKTYNVNISAHSDFISIDADDMSFVLECYEEESEEEGELIYRFVIYNDSPNIFIVGENTLAIPYDIFHTIDARYIEDTLLWQRGSGNQSVKTKNCTASGYSSHAEGNITNASGAISHAEGNRTTASGESSHAEGDGTTASGFSSHAEGNITNASGESSHAEGNGTTASGTTSHAEGSSTTASGVDSHAEGSHTIANHRNQHVFGEYNIQDPSTAAIGNRGTYVEIVGNGSSNNNKSNARTLDWNGNEVLAGKLTVGTQPTNDNDVATKKYVDDHSGGGALICTLNPNVSPRVLDHTFGEIYNALRSGRPVFMDDVMYGTIRSISQFIYASEQPNLYYIRFSDQAWNFLSGSIDDYPTEDLD